MAFASTVKASLVLVYETMQKVDRWSFVGGQGGNFCYSKNPSKGLRKTSKLCLWSVWIRFQPNSARRLDTGSQNESKLTTGHNFLRRGGAKQQEISYAAASLGYELKQSAFTGGR